MQADIHRLTVFRIAEAEQEEINKLKWIESEKSGFDIGWDHAWWIWTRKHKSNWWRAICASGLKKC
jgi:hypothetical protein